MTALVLMVPLLAMWFTDEVRWDAGDFLLAAALLFATGLAYERLARRAGNVAYRGASGLALGAALMLVWANLAVGVIGHEGDPANLMYIGVLAVGIAGSIIARFQPIGMARALLATAIAQALVATIALIGRLGAPSSGPAQIILTNGLFVALFVASAWLFRRAARMQTEARSL